MQSPLLCWECGDYLVDLSDPVIMAILNVTPDSFSGDGMKGSVDSARARAEQAVLDGAGILDIGGETTKPGSKGTSVQEELDRVIPVVEALRQFDVPLSVDTMKPAVMRESILAGASIINDVNALREPGAIETVVTSGVGVCVMHMQGAPRSMQNAPQYLDVIAEVDAFLEERIALLETAGMGRARISIDPGFGFGKTLDHNIELFRRQSIFSRHGLPLLIGVSRKSMLGKITGRDVCDRMPASVVAAVLAVQRGASVLRVHDVAETRDALAIWAAIDRTSAKSVEDAFCSRHNRHQNRGD